MARLVFALAAAEPELVSQVLGQIASLEIRLANRRPSGYLLPLGVGSCSGLRCYPPIHMRLKQDIRTVDDLEKNASKLVLEVAEQGRTVAIVVNGEARAVLMDVESNDRWRSAAALLKIIAQGEADVATGRLVSQDEAFDRAARVIDRMEKDD